ncbi:response regulator [Deinococcus taeanensis]|uniref:response regulator n=1 Tax=Deinococcus taeanensis TaxID=2737050 RepID=UPI001CDBD985|nr:response regulator [Deinococcus taeanensis]UBV42732.1 response regulator [Deinococcus taeanensis]
MTSSPLSPPLRVLIVEDDPQIAALHWRLLDRAGGFTVLGQAESLRVARAMIRTLRPDLLLLDVHLPDGRGLDLLREARVSGERVDAILVTAASDAPSVQDALLHGAADYLVKPVTPERFLLALDRARERAALWAQGHVHQGHLDALFTPPTPDAAGLDGDTLRRVRVALRDHGEVSAAELGAQLGLSRVTAWRYLEHLVDTGEASVSTAAPTGGRPAKRYRRR